MIDFFDFDYFNFCYYEDGIAKGRFTLTDFIATEDNVVPTLSVAEMIEMLPNYVRFERYLGEWHISDNHNSLYPHFERNVLLRDALFEMLKWLKQNKLI